MLNTRGMTKVKYKDSSDFWDTSKNHEKMIFGCVPIFIKRYGCNVTISFLLYFRISQI